MQPHKSREGMTISRVLRECLFDSADEANMNERETLAIAVVMLADTATDLGYQDPSDIDPILDVVRACWERSAGIRPSGTTARA